MKKQIIFGFCMAVVAVGLLAGCKKDGVVKLGIRTEGVDGAKVILTGTTTKTPMWQDGDEIYLNNTTKTVAIENGNASIEGIDGITTYRAVYPASIIAANSDISTNATVAVTLPQEQEYVADNSGNQIISIPMGAYLSSGYTLNFKNLCSLVKVHVANSQGFPLTMTSISLKALDNGVKLSGAGSATIDGSTNCGIEMSSTANDSVILTFPTTTNTVTIANNSSNDFYFVVPPFSEFSRVRIIVKTSAGTDTYTLEKTTGGVSVSRNNIATTSITLQDMTADPKIPFFTVNNSDKKVIFAPGNLHYTNGSWWFAEHQYSTNASTYSTSDFEHFFWGSSYNYGASESYYGVGDPAEYDWGSVNETIRTLEGGDWHTLSLAEWGYVCNSRDNSVSFNGGTPSKVLWAYATVDGKTGAILFPDGDVAITVAGKTFNPGATNFTTNVYTATEWDNNFEAAGCVFLPGAGYRYKVLEAGIAEYGMCMYWTSTRNSSNPSGAMGWIFNGSQAPYSYSQTRSTGAISLRLVQELH